jgi:hypothetical protein
MPTYPTVVQGNNRPVVRATLTHKDGTALDLTGARIWFQMRKADDKLFTVNAEADISGDPTLGKVLYEFGRNDLNVPGTYDVQWKVVYANQDVQTTASTNTLVVRRE